MQATNASSHHIPQLNKTTMTGSMVKAMVCYNER